MEEKNTVYQTGAGSVIVKGDYMINRRFQKDIDDEYHIKAVRVYSQSTYPKVKAESFSLHKTLNGKEEYYINDPCKFSGDMLEFIEKLDRKQIDKIVSDIENSPEPKKPWVYSFKGANCPSNPFRLFDLYYGRQNG